MVKKPQLAKNAGKVKPPKPDKKTKAAKPAKAAAAPKAEAAKAAVGHNSADPKMRELFLQHKPTIKRLREQLASANGKLRAALKAAKADGFTKAQFDVAFQLETPEGERDFRAKVANQLLAAVYVGADIGTQFDLFMEPVRTDATERAYDEGQRASMEKGPASPDYAPNTAQYDAFMKGYHDHQAGIANGFKSIDKGAKTRKAKPEVVEVPAASAPETPGDTPPTVPSSGQGMTRAEFNRMREDGGEASQFSRRPN